MERSNETQNDIRPPMPPENGCLQHVKSYYSRKFNILFVLAGIAISIVQLRYGIMYFNQCPMQPMISIHMVVHASIQVIIIVINILAFIDIRTIYARPEEKYQIRGRTILLVLLFFTIVLNLFILAWLIAGSIWVFGARNGGVQGSDPSNTATYCETDLIEAAFRLLIINYCLFGLTIFTLFCRNILRRPQHMSQHDPRAHYSAARY